jgi:hypothetical protein
MKYKLINLVFFLLLLTSCGFEVVKNTYGFNILEINAEGNKKISYALKNRIKINNSDLNKNFIKINIDSEKVKLIKEKNIQNKITKYEIKIVSNVKYMILPENITKTLTINKAANYNVADNKVETLNNEKKLIDNLIDEMADEILLKISLDFNDS